MLTIDPHPLLDLHAFVTTWPEPLGRIPAPWWLDPLTMLSAEVPFPQPDEPQRTAVRDLLRQGGFKPAGRSKPCNEYIRGAAEKGEFPRVNVAVDATNVAALHGGLPVSTVDRDKVHGTLHIGLAVDGDRYVFNRTGQEIDLTGLLCLHDEEGACANAVKDAQRSKTDEKTTRTLTIIWGTKALPGRAAAVADWHVALNERLGGAVERW